MNVSINRGSEESFQTAVCEKLGCTAESYAEAVFWHCLHPAGRLLAPWVLPRWGSHTADDFALIRRLAQCKTQGEVWREIDYHRFHRPPQGLLQNWLRLRVSLTKLMELAGQLLPAEERHYPIPQVVAQDLPPVFLSSASHACPPLRISRR